MSLAPVPTSFASQGNQCGVCPRHRILGRWSRWYPIFSFRAGKKASHKPPGDFVLQPKPKKQQQQQPHLGKQQHQLGKHNRISSSSRRRGNRSCATSKCCSFVGGALITGLSKSPTWISFIWGVLGRKEIEKVFTGVGGLFYSPLDVFSR